ncbi:MAG: hypothetical protein WD993_03285 [Thermoleophilaceae bacterium]
MTTAAETTETTVTRTEIADAVRAVFDSGTGTREDLLDAALQAKARSEAIEAISKLPPFKTYANLRQLWPDLPDMPVR